jgi:outer membrane lipoprotein LolB
MQMPDKHGDATSAVACRIFDVGRWTCSIFAIFLIAACAHKYMPTGQNGIKNDIIAGRLSLQVQSEPAQSLSAGFELVGDAQQGTLLLTTPLGSSIAQLQWWPGSATLTAQNKVQNYPSVEDILQQITGAAIPLPALLAWLQGQQADAAGWQADLSRFADGKLSAERSMPLPTAQLRIVLDR